MQQAKAQWKSNCQALKIHEGSTHLTSMGCEIDVVLQPEIDWAVGFEKSHHRVSLRMLQLLTRVVLGGAKWRKSGNALL